MIALYYAPIPDGMRHHEAGLALLETAAAQVWRDLPRPLSLHTVPGEKPRFAAAPEHHFNLSHGGSYAVCALSDQPVGVDLEQARPLRGKVSRRFTPEEQSWLETQPDEAFFDLWVKKEAYLKAIGTGLTRRLDSFSVLPLSVSITEDGLCNRLMDFPAEGYHLAVCGQPAPEIPLIHCSILSQK